MMPSMSYPLPFKALKLLSMRLLVEFNEPLNSHVFSLRMKDRAAMVYAVMFLAW